jgi:LacI family transcriptional regulator
MPKVRKTLPTIADVARECGVGSMTVSRVMNGNRHVSVAMTQRVRAAIIKLGYQPNEAARILKGHPPRTIGLIIPDLADPFFSTCAHAVQQFAAKHGFVTLLCAREGQKNTEAEELAMMNSRSVAGVLMVPSDVSSDHQFRELRARGVPMVMLDRTLPDLDAGEVMVDNREGAHKAINHLVEHGHRQILCVSYDSRFNSIAQRIAGYREAMTDAGLEPQLLIVNRESPISPQLLRRLRSPKRPTAFFTLNNVTTTDVLHTLQRENFSVPREAAIIGFGDFDLAPLLAVPLTAVRQPAAELGRSATRLLLDWIRSGSHAEHLSPRVLLPTELVIRQSCGCEPPPRIGSGSSL